MRTLKVLLLALVAGGVFCTTAFAEESWADNSGAKASAADNAAAADSAAPATDSYGRTPCQVAVNQGVVAYWYAHAYANTNGDFPKKFADIAAGGWNLRSWTSPHTGQAIDPDDGKLDFDGDFTYSYDCWDAKIVVKTAGGDVTLPSTLEGSDGCYGTCCDVTICGTECWKCPDICDVVQWILWKSFKLYDCLYACCPADVDEWMASGLAPYDKNVKELAPNMDVCYFYGNCCLKKAKVTCCKPCNPCASKCGSCNKCAKPSCNSCKSKCGGCEKPCANKCGSCNKCAKPSCNSCKSKCGGCEKPCESKCGSCNKCAKPSCNSCKSKCGGCEKPKCGSCAKKTCGSCNKCASKCNSCEKPKCGSCAKPSCGGCNKCKKPSGCNSCGKPSCGGCCG